MVPRLTFDGVETVEPGLGWNNRIADPEIACGSHVTLKQPAVANVTDVASAGVAVTVANSAAAATIPTTDLTNLRIHTPIRVDWLNARPLPAAQVKLYDLNPLQAGALALSLPGAAPRRHPGVRLLAAVAATV